MVDYSYRNMCPIDINFTALTTLSLRNDMTCGLLILQHNPQLKKITFSRCGFEPKTLDDIVQYAPNIEKLSIMEHGIDFHSKTTRSHWKSLLQLTSLQRLKIDSHIGDDGRAFSNFARSIGNAHIIEIISNR